MFFIFLRDARDAVDRRDGYGYMGRKLRVEFPRGERGGGGGDRYRGGRGGGGGGGGDRDRGRDSGRVSSVRRTKYRVLVAGMEVYWNFERPLGIYGLGDWD